MPSGDIRKRNPVRTFGGETFCIVGTQSGRKDVEEKTVKRLRAKGIKARLTHNKTYGWESWGNVKDINRIERHRRRR